MMPRCPRRARPGWSSRPSPAVRRPRASRRPGARWPRSLSGPQPSSTLPRAGYWYGPGGRGQKLTRRVPWRQPALLPLPREHPLREVQPLGQLAHLGLEPEEAVLEVRDAPLTRQAHLVRDFPARHATSLAVAKFTDGDHDDVVQVPDTEPAQREAHPDAARCAAGVEAMQPEDATHDAQAQCDAAGALGDRRRFVAHWIEVGPS